MADKYKSVQKTVTAIQFLFDNIKEIYMFCDMKDFSMSVKNRNLTGIITGSNEEKIPVNKSDYVVKDSDGKISVWKESDFNKNFVSA